MSTKQDFLDGEEFKPYKCYDVRMSYQAGHRQWNDWPCEGKTVHAGVGWFHPFGRSHYYAISGDCEEKKQFPIEKYFTDDWMDIYDTALFCIYRTDFGDIYAYDGIFMVRDDSGDDEIPYASSFLRRDALTNVIVGGTGKFEGARGILVGTAEGAGTVEKVGDDLTLPEGLLKCMTGFMKIPIKQEETEKEPEAAGE